MGWPQMIESCGHVPLRQRQKQTARENEQRRRRAVLANQAIRHRKAQNGLAGLVACTRDIDVVPDRNQYALWQRRAENVDEFYGPTHLLNLHGCVAWDELLARIGHRARISPGRKSWTDRDLLGAMAMCANETGTQVMDLTVTAYRDWYDTRAFDFVLPCYPTIRFRFGSWEAARHAAARSRRLPAPQPAAVAVCLAA
jgi:hypothetical protein